MTPRSCSTLDVLRRGWYHGGSRVPGRNATPPRLAPTPLGLEVRIWVLSTVIFDAPSSVTTLSLSSPPSPQASGLQKAGRYIGRHLPRGFFFFSDKRRSVFESHLPSPNPGFSLFYPLRFVPLVYQELINIFKDYFCGYFVGLTPKGLPWWLRSPAM